MLKNTKSVHFFHQFVWLNEMIDYFCISMDIQAKVLIIYNFKSHDG